MEAEQQQNKQSSDVESASLTKIDNNIEINKEEIVPHSTKEELLNSNMMQQSVLWHDVTSEKKEELLNNNILWNDDTTKNKDDHDEKDNRKGFTSSSSSRSHHLNAKSGDTDDDNQNDSNSNEYTKKKENEEHVLLKENIYSFVYFSRCRSYAFVFAIFIYSFQMAIILCTLLSLFDFDSDNNPLKIPPDVPELTTIGQVLAVALVPFTMNDVLESLVKVQEGYQIFDITVRNFKPGSTLIKWYLSIFLQFTAGSGLLVVIFILILQATSVIGIMLNFAALQFISEIDDMAFSLAKLGFVAKTIRLEAEEVTKFKTKVSRKASNRFRRVCFFLVFIALMIGMSILINWQREGKYLCNTIGVQFDDEIESALGTFSGVYELAENNKYASRAHYIDRRSGEALIAYCQSETAWTFSYVNNLHDDEPDPCNYAAKSQQTKSYDITEVSSGWLVKSTKLNITVPLKTFELWCNECSDVCSGRGICNESRCECHDGYFGINCRYSYACETLAIDQRTESFPAHHKRLEKDTFDLLRNDGKIVIVYGHPVYYHYYYTHGDRDYYNVMMYIGSRWVLETLTSDAFNRIRNFEDDYHYYYHKNFNSSHYNPEYYFYSDPVNVRVPDTIDSTPVGLHWYKGVDKNNPRLDMLSPIGTRVLCSNCDDIDNECFNQGQCNFTAGIHSSCDCHIGFNGSLCELELDVKCSSSDALNSNGSTFACLNNGTCDDEIGYCVCVGDYYGKMCQLDVNEDINE